MSVKVRFAPSPTGKLHIGNARTALITWLFARNRDGKFLLRIDDTDSSRSTEENVQVIKDALTWLNLDWDELERQSRRTEIYDAAVQKLKSSGRLYPCYETPEELELKRRAQLSRGAPPIYDRSALSLSDDQKKAFEKEGRKAHWRFKLNHDPIMWHDHIRGEQKFEGKDLSDPVLIREDGSPLYHICSVVDDIEFGITHIVRGEDHVTNSATHIQMFEALGAEAPEMAHLPLIADKGGGKLSKRFGSLSVSDVRDEEGLESLSVISYLARLGTSDPIEPFTSIRPLIESFDFGKFSRSTPKFDPDELLRLNAKILHNLSYPDVQDRLPSKMDESFWNTVKPNLTRLQDAADWWTIKNGPVEPVIEDTDYIALADSLLPSEPWDGGTWKRWTDALKEKTGRKGKDLFMPLRLALTGMAHGPEMHMLLPLIGEKNVRERLSKRKAA